jgi:hypothetical protein
VKKDRFTQSGRLPSAYVLERGTTDAEAEDDVRRSSPEFREAEQSTKRTVRHLLRALAAV